VCSSDLDLQKLWGQKPQARRRCAGYVVQLRALAFLQPRLANEN